MAGRYFTLVVLSFMCLFILPLFAHSNQETYGDAVGVHLRSCYDEDTCRFDIPGWPPIIGRTISVRLAGLDTPEIRGECDQKRPLAQKAKTLVNQKLATADTITLTQIRRGKYFRLVARVKAHGVDRLAWLNTE